MHHQSGHWRCLSGCAAPAGRQLTLLQATR
jgi:hypothetical protein